MPKRKVDEDEERVIPPGVYQVNADGSQERLGDVPEEGADEFGPNVKKYVLYREDEAKEWCIVGKHESRPGMEEFVKDTYGGGSYKAHGYNEKGKFEKGNVRYFKVDKMYPQKNLSGVSQTSTPSTALIPTPDNTPFVRLEILLTKMVELQMANQSPKTDPLEMVEKVARILKPADLPPAQNPVTEMIAMFKQGFEMGQMTGGDAGYWPIVEKLGEPAIKLIQQLAQNPVNGQRVLDKAKEVNGSTFKQEGPTMFEQLLKFVPQVIPAAKSNISAEDAVDNILDRVPPIFYEAIYNEISKANFLENIIVSMPEVKNYEEWFKGFVEKFREMLSPEEEEVGETLNLSGEGNE